MTADGPRPDPTPPDADDSVSWWGMAGMGLEFVATVGAMGLLGWYLDRRWLTSPWLLVAGVVVGFAAGLMTLIRTARKAFKD